MSNCKRAGIVICLTTVFLWAITSNAYANSPNGENSDPPVENTLTYTNKSSRQLRNFDQLSEFSFGEFEAAEERFYDERNYIAPSANDLSLRAKIEATYEKVKSENRFVEFLSEGSLFKLPLGIKSSIGALDYIILVDSVVLSPTESKLFASMRFETPQGKAIHFKGSGIKFSREGGLTGEGTLALVGDYPINIGNGDTQLILKGSNEKTFVEFNCNGYKQASIDASFLFSRNLLLPEDANGDIIDDQNVALDFTTTIIDWNDLIVEASLPKFQVRGLKDVSFTVSNAVLDLSDTRNAPAVVFPEGYNSISPELLSGTPELWRGLFVRDISVELPPQFILKDNDSNETDTLKNRVRFRGENIIVDDIGFSGKVSGENLIPIERGRIGNWPFSLEKIYINLVANELSEAGFNGKVNIPVNKVNLEADQSSAGGKEGKLFKYTAVINPGNEYLFNVSNQDTLFFDLWKADVTLNPDSYVEVRLKNKKFLPKAHLNGRMDINLGLKGDDGAPEAKKSDNLKAVNITFQGLEIQTVRPYLKIASFSLGGLSAGSSLAGFSMSIDNVKGETRSNKILLGMDITIGLTKAAGGSYAATGGFVIESKELDNGDLLSYRYGGIDITKFAVAIDKGPFKFKGHLNFFKEDKIYGNGISGTVDATFSPGVGVKGTAIFGNKDDERFWYVDALATFDSGIPVFPGMAFYSFGGGAYYHMKLDNENVGSELGRTASGVTYVPDTGTSFGFKATAGFGVHPGKESFNGDVTYEMAFNSGGGVKYINLSGNGYFLSSLDNSIIKLKEQTEKMVEIAKKYNSANLVEIPGTAEEIHGDPKSNSRGAVVWANVNLNFDFENKVFHGTFDSYMNVAGALKGGGPNNKAGNITMHFGQGEWYIYIGRPEYENRFSIEVLGIARFDAYLVMGSVIPDTPPPPTEVSEIIGQDIDVDYMKDLNALEDGGGVGFGASFRVDTGDITFLIFYGRFRAGMGFDVMLKDYGSTECQGRGRIGINGWYANAQAYGYFEGSVGIKVKIFGFKKKIKILELGTALLTQAKLPNPTWFQAVAAIKYRVLGGLIKGRVRFKITIGKECEVIQEGSVLETVEVIAEISPQENTRDVSVFTVPQVVFNYEMEREYEAIDYNERVVKFRIQLEEFKLMQEGKLLDANLEWNGDKSVAVLKTFDVLPPQQEITLSVSTAFQEFKNGYWTVAVVDGQPLRSTKTIKFTTSEAPSYIPEENIAYSYPTFNQVNYYQDEYREGYVMLKKGQPYLFEDNPEWSTVLRVEDINGNGSQAPLTYNSASRQVSFTMPGGLANDRFYHITMVNAPKTSLGQIDANVTVNNTNSELGDGDGTISIRSRELSGGLKDIKEKVIYDSYFRTSRYNTFKEKIASTNPSAGWRNRTSGVHVIGSNIGGPEPFALEEIYGDNGNPPLIDLEADLSENYWYNYDIYPLIYHSYPLAGQIRISSTNRDITQLGLIPTKGVFLYQYPFDIKITASEITANTIDFPSEGAARFDYFLPYFMYYDYRDLSTQAANYVIRTGNTSNAKINNLISSEFPVIRKGDYWMQLNYRLPGKGTVTSSYRHKIYNPIER
ncbi:MAG: hypothetical protein WBA74_12725 [Cyclobacteriaceae bacterium]